MGWWLLDVGFLLLAGIAVIGLLVENRRLKLRNDSLELRASDLEIENRYLRRHDG